VAARYGVKFANYERDGRMRLCYEGDAFRRVLAMRSTPEQRARAVLALTRAECVNPGLRVTERYQADELRAEVLDRVDAAALPAYLKNRVLMRRASVWSAIAYQHTRKNLPSDAAANRALTELGGINKAELTDDDLAVYADAAMRASASRWAVVPVAVAVKVARHFDRDGAWRGRPDLRRARRCEARHQKSAGQTLHLWNRVGELRDIESRR
jgi:hypothetical protein